MNDEREFLNLYHHGLIRVAVGVPAVRVADPAFNGARTLELMEKAEAEKAILALFPELGLSAYSCDDLFQQQALLDGSLEALSSLLKASERSNLISVVGMPLRVDHLLFNCAVVFCHGKILGIIPKTFLPNYREFYEYRQFAPAAAAFSTAIAVLDQGEIPFGEHLIFQCQEHAQFTFFVEICEDLWVPIPPSCHAALAGATVILNLSASNITIAKMSIATVWSRTNRRAA
jgi:NAD+ synthase (glutamine-hydrolysing)